MNATTQRTPSPWEAFGPSPYQIYGGDPKCRIAVMDFINGNDGAENAANAAFIVEACNNYERVCAELDALAKALREVVESNAADIEEGKRGYSIGSPRHQMWKRARAALAKVTPVEPSDPDLRQGRYAQYDAGTGKRL